jgi:hypothetical protein
MSLLPEKSLAAEKNEKTTETAKNNKRLVIGLITGLIALFFIIIFIYNSNASSFRVAKNIPNIDNEQYRVITVIERKRPFTFINFIYDKLEKQYIVDVVNPSNQPIKFYPSSFEIVWPNGNVSTIGSKEEDLIPPGYSSKYRTSKYITSMPKAIMYYPKDNPKTGITVTLKE